MSTLPDTTSASRQRTARKADGPLAVPDFQALFELSPNPYMVLDRGLRYVAANAAYLRVTSSRLEDLVGRHVFDAFPNDPSDPDNSSARLLRESFERVLREGVPDTLALIRYRVPVQTAQGIVDEERYWSATHTPLLDENGEVAFILQHTVDVTELQRLKQASAGPGASGAPPSLLLEAGVLSRAQGVQEANRRLHGLLMQAPVAIGIFRGPEHIVELVNPLMCRNLGRTADQLLGRPILAALPELEGQGFDALLDGVFSSGVPYVGTEVPAELARLQGGHTEVGYFNLVYEPLRDDQGRVEGILQVGTEVTEGVLARRRVEELKARAEEGIRLRDEFLSVASHELKTPLTTLALRLAQLRREALAPPDGSAPREQEVPKLEAAERQVQKLSALVGSLLDVSRLSSGRLVLSLEPVDLSAVVHEVVSRFEPEAERAGSRLHVQSDGPAVGHWDRLRLEQVVTNLLSNALKYGAGKPIHLTVESGAGRARLSVRDEGIGIEPAALERIFQKFERAVSDRHYGGLGLGLYVTKQIAEALGGAVRAESTPGRGATFVVELPLTGAAAGP